MAVIGPGGVNPGNNPQQAAAPTDRGPTEETSRSPSPREPHAVETSKWRLSLRFVSIDPFRMKPEGQIEVILKTPQGSPLVTFSTHPLNSRLTETLYTAFPYSPNSSMDPSGVLLVVTEHLFGRRGKPWIVVEAPLSQREHATIPGAFYAAPSPSDFFGSKTLYEREVLAVSEHEGQESTMKLSPNPSNGFIVATFPSDTHPTLGPRGEEFRIPLVPKAKDSGSEILAQMERTMARLVAVFSERGREGFDDFIAGNFPQTVVIPSDSSDLMRRDGELSRAILRSDARCHTIPDTGATLSCEIGIKAACIQIAPQAGDYARAIEIVFTRASEPFTSTQTAFIQKAYTLLCSPSREDRRRALSCVFGLGPSKQALLFGTVPTTQRSALLSSVNDMAINMWGPTSSHPDIINPQVLADAAMHNVSVTLASSSDLQTVQEYMDGQVPLVFSDEHEVDPNYPSSIRNARLTSGAEGTGQLLLFNGLSGQLEVSYTLENPSDPTEYEALCKDIIQAFVAQRERGWHSFAELLRSHPALHNTLLEQFEFTPTRVSIPPPIDTGACSALDAVNDFVMRCREAGTPSSGTFSSHYAGDGSVVLTIKVEKDLPTVMVRFCANAVTEISFSNVCWQGKPKGGELVLRRFLSFVTLEGLALDSAQGRAFLAGLEDFVCCPQDKTVWPRLPLIEHVAPALAPILDQNFVKHEHRNHPIYNQSPPPPTEPNNPPGRIPS